jgi:hypothetical protein
VVAGAARIEDALAVASEVVSVRDYARVSDDVADLADWAAGVARGGSSADEGSETAHMLEQVSQLADAAKASDSRVVAGEVREAELVASTQQLESELLAHQSVADDLAYESSAAFAKDTARAADKATGLRLPELPAGYDYRDALGKNGAPMQVVKRSDHAGPKKILVPDGKNWKLADDLDAPPTAAQERAVLRAGMGKEQSDAFEQLERANPGALKTVPLKGVYADSKTLGGLMTSDQTRELERLLLEGYTAAGREDAFAEALDAFDRIMDHKLTVIHGTNQLRVHVKTVKGVEMHHLSPLYLGGDNGLILALAPKVHGQIHELFRRISLGNDTTLDPRSVKGAFTLAEGAAVVQSAARGDGAIQYNRWTGKAYERI